MPAVSIYLTDSELVAAEKVAADMGTTVGILSSRSFVEFVESYNDNLDLTRAVNKRLDDLRGGRNRARLDDETLRKIMADLDGTEKPTVTLLAKRYGISRNTLMSRLRRNGYRKGGGRPQKLSDKELHELAQLKKAGSSWDQVSQIAGMTVNGVRQALLRNGYILGIGSPAS